MNPARTSLSFVIALFTAPVSTVVRLRPPIQKLIKFILVLVHICTAVLLRITVDGDMQQVAIGIKGNDENAQSRPAAVDVQLLLEISGYFRCQKNRD